MHESYQSSMKTSHLAIAVVIRNENSKTTQHEVYQIVASQTATYKRLAGGIYFISECLMTPFNKVVRKKKMAQHYYDGKKSRNHPNANKLLYFYNLFLANRSTKMAIST